MKYLFTKDIVNIEIEDFRQPEECLEPVFTAKHDVFLPHLAHLLGQKFILRWL